MAAAYHYEPPQRFFFRAADSKIGKNGAKSFFRRATKIHKEEGEVQRDSLLYAMGTKQAALIMSTFK